MTKLLDEAMTGRPPLAAGNSGDIGRFLLELASEPSLEPDEIAALDEAEAEIARASGRLPKACALSGVLMGCDSRLYPASAAGS